MPNRSEWIKPQCRKNSRVTIDAVMGMSCVCGTVIEVVHEVCIAKRTLWNEYNVKSMEQLNVQWLPSVLQ